MFAEVWALISWKHGLWIQEFPEFQNFVVYSGGFFFLFSWALFPITYCQIDSYILILEVIMFQRLTYLVLFQKSELGSLDRNTMRQISSDWKEQWSGLSCKIGMFITESIQAKGGGLFA